MSAQIDQPEHLHPLKTLHETRANDQFVEALVFEIPAKLASKTLGLVKPVLQEAPKQAQLHHLRRLIHLPHLPKDLLDRRVVVAKASHPCVFLIQVATQDLADAIIAVLKQAIDNDPDLVEYSQLPRCFPVIVPLHGPLNEVQAKQWSERFWPSIFNPAAQVLQDAPPLHLLRKIRGELENDMLHSYLELAKHAGDQARLRGHGLGIGAVVVDPQSKEVVAVAGDARFFPEIRNVDRDTEGGRPEYHALMRAISMVANKELRRRLANGSHAKFASTCSQGVTGRALTSIEGHYLDPETWDSAGDPRFAGLPPHHSTAAGELSRSEGYLCSGLDVYLTHEPCVCCAMAMIHSRFRSCVFLNRMTYSGALGARTFQSALGYGLFWRRELNWRVLTFHYRRPDQERPPVLKDMFHA